MTAEQSSDSAVVVCQGGFATKIEAQPIPRPSAGEVLLKLRVVGFCGTDLFKLATGAAQTGTVLGHELVGEVVAIGDNTRDLHIGDRLSVPHHAPCGECELCVRGSETM